MGFKRAQWRSGLTYRQVCETCKNVVTYMDDVLDFRPWYPDGFVYCSRCKTPLRHNENYAINRPYVATPTYAPPVYAPPTPQVAPVGRAMFCRHCGRRFNDDDVFCAGCGKRRD